MSQSNANPKPAEAKKNVFTQLLIAGSAACFADVVTFPFDTAKVRLQLQGESTTAAGHAPVKNPKNLLKAGRSIAMSTPNATFLATERSFISTAFPVDAKGIAASPSSSTVTTATTAMSKATNVQYRGLFGTISTIARQEGPRALYNGLSAGLQRQMVFASVRLGMYDSVKATYQGILKERPDSLQVLSRVLAGITTGAMAVIVGQPTEVVKIRFQAQKRVAGAAVQQLLYTSTVATYRKIGREEGIRGLWKGALPNMGRNAVVNVAEIVCYDIVKDCLMAYAHMRDNVYCHFTAAVIAGFAATVAASPVDVIKTRYMNSPKGQYSGAFDCAVRTAKQEGSSAFYKGFMPAFVRLVSWNIVLWVTYEQIKKVVYQTKEQDEH